MKSMQQQQQQLIITWIILALYWTTVKAATVTDTLSTEESWITRKAIGDIPTFRSSPILEKIGGKAYLFGGFNPDFFESFYVQDRKYFNDLYSLTFSTMTWKKLSPRGTVPSPRGFHASATYNGKLYIYGGGVTGFNAQDSSVFARSYNDLFEYNPKQNEWTLLKNKHDDSPVPPASQGPALHVYANKVFVIGGLHTENDEASGQILSETLSEVWCFDLIQREWKRLSASDDPTTGLVFPSLWNSASLIRPLRHKIFLYGGAQQKRFSVENLSDLTYSYSIDMNKWQIIHPLTEHPMQRGGSTGIKYYDEWIIQGGDVLDADETTKDRCGVYNPDQGRFIRVNPSSETWKYSFQTKAWTRLSDAPTRGGNYRHVSVKWREYFVVLGGLGCLNKVAGQDVQFVYHSFDTINLLSMK